MDLKDKTYLPNFNEEGSNKEIFACSHCRKVFKQTSRQEVSKDEIKRMKYQCPQCNKSSRINTTYLDEFQITKMKGIAEKLDAIVVGDDGEEY